MNFRKQNFKQGIKILKSFGLTTVIIAFITTLSLLLFQNFNEVKSPVMITKVKIGALKSEPFWAAAVVLIIVIVVLLIIKLNHSIVKFSKKIYFYTYITIIDKLCAGLLLGLVLYRVLKWGGLKNLDFIPDYYVLLGILLIHLSIRVYKIFNVKSKEAYNVGFISDSPANQDLLNRSNIVESLTNSIKGVSVEGSFIIGMYGEWGEGKTTVLNMVENHLQLEEDIHILRFEPWHYNSVDAIIKNFFDMICDSLGKKHLSLDLIILISDYRDLLLNTLKGFKFNKVVEILIPNISSKQNTNNIKNKIEHKLKNLDQKVVIFVDDLDRMERTEILLVFKLVKLFSDFNNFIYVLSFDRKRLERILIREMSADKNYLDKIIQVGFELPKIPENTLASILIGFLNKYFSQFTIELDQDTNNKMQRIIPEISLLFDDIRKIKRFYNLLCIKYPMSKEKINFYDYFIITTIEFFFPEQYQEIYKHKNNFVYYVSDLTYSIRRKDLNSERKEYYKIFFGKIKNENKRSVLKKLLGSIFQSINNYNSGYSNLTSDYSVNYNDLSEKKIEDSKFFDYYFTFEKNDFMLMNDQIEEFIIILNHNEVLNETRKKFSSLLKAFSPEEQVLFFQNLNGYLKSINTNNYYLLAQLICRYSFLYDDNNRGFMQLSAYSHAQATVAEIIRILKPDNLKKEILKEVVTTCYDIEFVRGVLYFSKRDVEESATFSNLRENCIQLFKVRLVKKYFDYETNIFSEKQKHHGMWTLVEYTDDRMQLANYYYKMIEKNPRNIIKFISIFKNEITSYSSDGTRTRVELSWKEFIKYFDKKRINNYIETYKNMNTLNEEEVKMVNLFKNFYNGEKMEI